MKRYVLVFKDGPAKDKIIEWPELPCVFTFAVSPDIPMGPSVRVPEPNDYLKIGAVRYRLSHLYELRGIAFGYYYVDEQQQTEGREGGETVKKKFIETLEVRFLQKLGEKPSWGRNEVKEVFRQAVYETVLEILDKEEDNAERVD